MTSPSPLALGTPFSLGDPSVLHTARGDRLALGVNFLPSTDPLGALSGIVHGPAGSMGELTLVSDAVLRVEPFVALLQGTHNARQGQYVVPNEQQRDLAVVGKDATLFRRSLLVVRVADSLEAGVAPSAATNGAWLERVDGALAASNPVLPGVPANSLPLGELSIPSAASGQPVQLTPYNPRTGARHGILPVVNDALTIVGHGGAPGTYVGQYRDHPTRGLERWDGAAWHPYGLPRDTGWQNFANPTSPIVRGADGMRYRERNGRFSFQLHGVYQGAYADGFTLHTLSAGHRPAHNHWVTGNLFGPYTPFEFAIRPNGAMVILGRNIVAAGFVVSGSFEIG